MGQEWTTKHSKLSSSFVLCCRISHYFDIVHRFLNNNHNDIPFDSPIIVNSYHEAFLRSRPDLTQLVNRLKNPGKRVPNIEAEPKFYEMPFMPELPAHQHQNTLTLSTTRSANASVGVMINPSQNLIGPSAHGLNAASNAVQVPVAGAEVTPQLQQLFGQNLNSQSAITSERVVNNSSQNQICPSSLGLNAASNTLQFPMTPNYHPAVAASTTIPYLQQLSGQTSNPINITAAQTLLNNAINLQTLQALQASSSQLPNNMSLLGGIAGIQGDSQMQQQQQTTTLQVGPGVVVFGVSNQPDIPFPSVSQLQNISFQPPGSTTVGQPCLSNLLSGGLARLQDNLQMHQQQNVSLQLLGAAASLPNQSNMRFPGVMQTTGELRPFNIRSEFEKRSAGLDRTRATLKEHAPNDNLHSSQYLNLSGSSHGHTSSDASKKSAPLSGSANCGFNQEAETIECHTQNTDTLESSQFMSNNSMSNWVFPYLQAIDASAQRNATSSIVASPSAAMSHAALSTRRTDLLELREQRDALLGYHPNSLTRESYLEVYSPPLENLSGRQSCNHGNSKDPPKKA